MGYIKYKDPVKAAQSGKGQQQIKAWMRRELLKVPRPSPPLTDPHCPSPTLTAPHRHRQPPSPVRSAARSHPG